MGIRSKTPRKSCPFCGHDNTYAGTILTGSFPNERVLGAVRCNECGVEFAESWKPGTEEYDRNMLEAMVVKWNRRADGNGSA